MFAVSSLSISRPGAPVERGMLPEEPRVPSRTDRVMHARAPHRPLHQPDAGPSRLRTVTISSSYSAPARPEWPQRTERRPSVLHQASAQLSDPRPAQTPNPSTLKSRVLPIIPALKPSCHPATRVKCLPILPPIQTSSLHVRPKHKPRRQPSMIETAVKATIAKRERERNERKLPPVMSEPQSRRRRASDPGPVPPAHLLAKAPHPSQFGPWRRTKVKQHVAKPYVSVRPMPPAQTLGWAHPPSRGSFIKPINMSSLRYQIES